MTDITIDLSVPGDITVTQTQPVIEIEAPESPSIVVETVGPAGVSKEYVDARTPPIVKSTVAPTDLNAVWIDLN